MEGRATLPTPVTGNTDQTLPENRAYFPALDGLRAVALFMVILQHYLHIPWMFTGVDLFFVLSGFLITGILFDTQNSPHRVRNFYIRRTLRIFPLYYGLLLALALTTLFMHWDVTRPWLAWPLYAGNFLHGLHPYVHGTPWQRAADAHLAGTGELGSGTMLFLGHLWSLCVEEQFYLLWPWVVFLVRSRRALLWICVAITLLTPLLRALVLAFSHAPLADPEALYRFTPLRIDSLLLGGLIALMYRGRERAWMLRAGRMLALLCTVVAAVYYVHTVRLGEVFDLHVYPGWRMSWGLAFVDVYAATLIVTAIQPRTWLYRRLSGPALRSLGRISYGGYVFHDLYHQPLHQLAYQWCGGGPNRASVDLLVFALALLVTYALAWLSFRFFETPFLNLKSRWA